MESLTTSNITEGSSASPKIKISPRSSWDILEKSLLHPIVVYNTENLSELTLVRVDRVQKIDELHELINKFMTSSENVKSIDNPQIGDNCLVPLDDEYVRGRIINFEEQENIKYSSVFICDFGRIERYHLHEVFETSHEIVEFIPFTAIMGSFSGITLNNEEIITKKVSEFIQNSSKQGEIYAKVIDVKKSHTWLSGIYYYDLVLTLRDKNDRITILNDELVKNGFAKWDDTLGPKIQKMTPELFLKDLLLNQKENTEENWDELVGTHIKTEATGGTTSEENDMESLAKMSNELFGNKEHELYFDDEEMIEMMKMFKLDSYIPIYKASMAKRKITTSQKSLQAIKSSESSGYETETSQKEEVINDPKSNYDTLIHTSKQPEVLWQQNHFMVVISIHVGDYHDYHLEITKSSMIFANFIPNEQPQVTIINFFGQVKTKHVSHNIRGLRLVIRLPKQFVGISWPTVQKEEDKIFNIKYNLESMETLDEEIEPIIRIPEKELKSTENEYFEDDDSTDEYEDEEEHDELEDPLFDGII